MADSESTQKSTKAPAAKRSEKLTADEATPEDAPPSVEVPVSQLIEQGQDFVGYPSYTVAGALSTHDREEMMDPTDAKTAVETWLEQPVEVDDADDESPDGEEG